MLHKQKKRLLFSGLGILLVLVGLLLWKSALPKLRLEKITQAAQARQQVYNMLGLTVDTPFDSEKILDCYIDESFRVCILLREDAKEAEPLLREMLKKYEGQLRFLYTDLTPESLEAAKDQILQRLSEQGFAPEGASCYFSENSYFPGRQITLSYGNKDDLLAASKWSKKQGAPFNHPYINLKFVLKDGKERRYPDYSDILDYTNEDLYVSEEAAAFLQAYLKEQKDYRSFYRGYVIGEDARLHIYFKEGGDPEGQNALKKAMKPYASVITYSATAADTEASDTYLRDLTNALTELGLQAWSGGIHGHGNQGSGQIYIGMDARNIPAAQALLKENMPYPFGQHDYQVYFHPQGQLQHDVLYDYHPPMIREDPSGSSRNYWAAYTPMESPEATAIDALERFIDVQRVLHAESSEALAELNRLLPVECSQLRYYGYDAEYMAEHFCVVTARAETTIGTLDFMVKLIQDPENGLWHVWFLGTCKL